jgi:hypothetical protein
VTKGLRLVVFSESIISDIANPQATTVRAMCQAFANLGHDVTHLEERGNPVLTRMLRTRGYGPMRAFNQRYPQIRYRQYEMPGGAERSVWFGREVATADAVAAYPGTPETVIAELEARDDARLVRFWAGQADPDDLWLQWAMPAVLPRTGSDARSGWLVVAYDDTNPITADAMDRLALGTLDDPDWPFFPEIEAEDRYLRAEAVFIKATENLARQLLPVANGATTVLFGTDGRPIGGNSDVPQQFDARRRAARLTVEIDRILGERRSSGR